MRRWRIAVGALAVAVVLGLAAVALGAFTAQTTTGAVSLAVAEDGANLYICDKTTGGGVVVTLPNGRTVQGCASDDTGGNEMIFERDEKLLPGQTETWDIVLWNSSNAEWDLPDFNVEYPSVGKLVTLDVAEVTDPGGDCNAVPRLDVSIVKRLRAQGQVDPPTGHDPPGTGVAAIAPSQGYVIEQPGPSVNLIPHARTGLASDDPSGLWTRLRAIIDLTVGDVCQGNEWSITIGWNVVPHGA